ncbi:MAG: adenine deaminase, partial [Euryarchaeota archaeon]|nr:adenine deaminase [Euryarchaeota archaeon]
APGIGWREVKSLLSTEDYVALGEVTDYRELINEAPGIMGKVEVATQLGKKVDGHAPGLSGYELDRYIMAGVSSDHECFSTREAEEKHRKGMRVAVRDGSGARNMRALIPFARANKHLLATDHLRARDLVEGHIDNLLRQAVAEGLDPVQAIRSVTLWPAEHYGIIGGSLQVGSVGDLTVVSDLKTFKVLETWIGGVLVAKGGAPLFTSKAPEPIRHAYSGQRLGEVHAVGQGHVAAVKVIMADQPEGAPLGQVDLPVIDGTIVADPLRDILYLVWADPTEDWTLRTGFVSGFTLRTGALASSEIYGPGGIVGIGASLPEVEEALGMVVDRGGGAVALLNGQYTCLDLPVAGLMSERPAEEVASQEKALLAQTRAMGCSMNDPFLVLALLGRELPRAFQSEKPLMVMEI